MMKRDEAEILLAEYRKMLDGASAQRVRFINARGHAESPWKIEHDIKEFEAKAEAIRLKLLVELIS